MRAAPSIFATFYTFSVMLAIKWWPSDQIKNLRENLFAFDMFTPETQNVPAEALMTTMEIVASRGYPLQIHRVITEDGYILELHRIPSSPNSPFVANKKPILLQHGLIGSDIVWVFNSNKSLAFILADNGYDVWMGNYRGNVYSRRHLTLDPSQEAFWQHTWDDIGKFDIPAFIRYILKYTGQDKVSLVGHSMATALFSIALIEDPTLNEQVDQVFCFGPAVSNPGVTSFMFKLLDVSIGLYDMIQKATGSYVFLANDSVEMEAFRSVCKSSATGAAFCRRVLFDIFGHSQIFNEDLLHVMFHHYPSGSSLGAMKQWLQTYYSGHTFRRFDHGVQGNLERYGTEIPPEYDFTKVAVPFHLFWGENDPLSAPEDVAWLAKQLGNFSVSIRVDDPHFTHGDFVWSPMADQLIYNPIMKLLNGESLNLTKGQQVKRNKVA